MVQKPTLQMQEADDKFNWTFQQHLDFTVSHCQTLSEELSRIVSLNPYKPKGLYQCVWRLQRLNLKAQGSKSRRQTGLVTSLWTGWWLITKEAWVERPDSTGLILPPFNRIRLCCAQESLLRVDAQNHTHCALWVIQGVEVHNSKSVRFSSSTLAFRTWLT